ncbi:MAG: metal ABC transporter permease [Crenarchaeota archaeon]|nr:metal ABC transporter permease [Thermoproteota archaeon]
MSLIVELVCVSILIALLAGYSSTFTSISRSSFLVVTISHAILATLAALFYIAYIYSLHVGPLLIWLVMFVTALSVCAFVSHVRLFSERDLVLSIIFALMLSIAALFMAVLPGYMVSRMWSFLTGSLLLITPVDISLIFIICLICSTLYTFFYREFLLVSYDYEYALATSISASAMNYVLSILISIATLACVYVLGLFVTYAVMLIPGSVLVNARVRPSTSVIMSIMIVFITLMISIGLAFSYNIPPSGLCGVMISVLAGLVILVRFLTRRIKRTRS